MGPSLIEELITRNKPLKIETASGQVFEVPHRDFVSFSTRKTSLTVSYEENRAEHFAIVPLLTIYLCDGAGLIPNENHRFETRSFPGSLAATRRGFAFYLADPIGSVHGLHRFEFFGESKHSGGCRIRSKFCPFC